jgi:hypothetical protein
VARRATVNQWSVFVTRPYPGSGREDDVRGTRSAPPTAA